MEGREGLFQAGASGCARPAGQLQQARLGLDLALSCKSMSVIVAHATVSQFIGEKSQCCKEACHLAASVGAEESQCLVEPSP